MSQVVNIIFIKYNDVYLNMYFLSIKSLFFNKKKRLLVSKKEFSKEMAK